MLADRQTQTHTDRLTDTHRNNPLPYLGGVIEILTYMHRTKPN